MDRNGCLGIAAVLLPVLLSSCKWPQLDAPTPPSPPGMPQLILTGPHQATLTWDYGGSSASYSSPDVFVIQRNENNTGYVELGQVNGNRRLFVDSGITPTNDYRYMVYAKLAERESVPADSAVYRHPYLDACNDPIPAPRGTKKSFWDFPVSRLNYKHNQTYSVTDSSGAFEWGPAQTSPRLPWQTMVFTPWKVELTSTGTRR